MKMKTSYFVILALMVLSAFVAWRSYLSFYVGQDTIDVHSFPKEIEGWVSEDVELTEREYEILETRNVLARRYYNNADKKMVMLTIVYSQTNRKVSHPPEICYTGGGASFLEKSPDTIDLGQGKKLDVQKLYLLQDRFHQVVLYTFKIGNVFTPNYWKQQLLIAWNYLRGKPSSSALIRVSGFSLSDKNRPETEQTAKEFASMIVPLVQQYLP